MPLLRIAALRKAAFHAPSRMPRDLPLPCTTVNALRPRCLALLLAFGFSALAFAANLEPLANDIAAKPCMCSLDTMLQRLVIRVLTPYSKTFYFVDIGGTQRGISYEMMRAFEDSLNAKQKKSALKVHVVFVATNRDQLIPQLLAGK